MRRYLRSKGYTQDEIASHLRLAPYLLSKKLRFKGSKGLNGEEIFRIIDYTGIPMCEFLEAYYITYNDSALRK